MNRFTFIVIPAAGKESGRKSSTPCWGTRSNIHIVRYRRDDRSGTCDRSGPDRINTGHRERGGDGTINEIANGITGSTKTLGIIPAGSGNDFIKSIGVPRSLSRRCRRSSRGPHGRWISEPSDAPLQEKGEATSRPDCLLTAWAWGSMPRSLRGPGKSHSSQERHCMCLPCSRLSENTLLRNQDPIRRIFARGQGSAHCRWEREMCRRRVLSHP